MKAVHIQYDNPSGWLGSVKKSIASLGFPALLLLFATITLLFGCEKSADLGVNSTPTAATPSVSNLTYNLGDTIRFGAGGGSERFRLAGWSGTENDRTWTEGNSAKLVIPVSAIDRPLRLRMKLAGLTKADQPFQPVEVIANGQKIADWEVGAGPDFTAVIPSEISKAGGSITIELKIPKAFSPKSAGMSSDPRVLGVACSELSLSGSD